MSTLNISNLGFAELRTKYLTKELTPIEVTEYYLNKLEANTHLNHCITICREHALQQAKESTERYNNNTARPLEGMPLAVKDLFCTKGIRTTAASKLLSNFVPDYESYVTTKAFENGAIMLAKTNMDEFAMGGANKYSAFGQAINPLQPKESAISDCNTTSYTTSNSYINNETSKTSNCNQTTQYTNQQFVTGGSSGGSAGAVAAGDCLFALGSDTGGSVRQPAAFCGIVGLRPTYGRCSRRGMIAFSSSLDQAGVFARDVSTTAVLAEIIMGHDPYDDTSVNLPVPKLTQCKGNIAGLKIGILTDHLVSDPSIKQHYRQIQDLLQNHGAIITPVTINTLDLVIAMYYVLAPVEAMSNMARYDGIRYGERGTGDTYAQICKNSRDLIGDEVKRRILLGTYLSSSECYNEYYIKALALKQQLQQEFHKVFQELDLLISPTTPHTAFPINEQKSPADLYYEDYYTCPINLAGLCGMSLPIGFSSTTGMPIGLQLIGKPFDEEILITAGLALETLLKIEEINH